MHVHVHVHMYVGTQLHKMLPAICLRSPLTRTLTLTLTMTMARTRTRTQTQTRTRTLNHGPNPNPNPNPNPDPKPGMPKITIFSMVKKLELSVQGPQVQGPQEGEQTALT